MMNECAYDYQKPIYEKGWNDAVSVFMRILNMTGNERIARFGSNNIDDIVEIPYDVIIENISKSFVLGDEVYNSDNEFGIIVGIDHNYNPIVVNDMGISYQDNSKESWCRTGYNYGEIKNAIEIFKKRRDKKCCT